MGGSHRHRASTAGEHLATYTAEASALKMPITSITPWVEGCRDMEACLQPVRIKTPAPSPDALFAAGGEGGRGAYLDTDRNISPQIFEGRTVDYEEKERNRKRFKYLANISRALYEGGEEDAGLRLLGCGRWFQRMNLPNEPCGYRLLPYPCDSPFCPDCAARKAKPLQQKIWKRINRTKHDYFMATVTLKNWKALERESLDVFIEAFAKLRESQLWKDEVSGGSYSLEVTYNRETGEWHPHAHCLIETGKDLRMDWIFELQNLWFQITGRFFDEPSNWIHLTPIYSINKKGRKVRKINHAAIRELVKYSTKAADFSDQPARVMEFYRAFKNVRRVQMFGNFLGAMKEIERDEENEKQALIGCACGKCRWCDVKPAGVVHISQTILMFDGTRQLRLFDSGSDPPVEVISVEHDKYNNSGTALGAIQKTSPLFDVAPMAF